MGKRLKKATEKLLLKMEEAIDREEGFELRDFKAMTGALREMGELLRDSGAEAAAQALTVKFSGEAEELSQ